MSDQPVACAACKHRTKTKPVVNPGRCDRDHPPGSVIRPGDHLSPCERFEPKDAEAIQDLLNELRGLRRQVKAIEDTVNDTNDRMSGGTYPRDTPEPDKDGLSITIRKYREGDSCDCCGQSEAEDDHA